ncbi:hypothetical protein H7F15_17955 [Pontibacter sp. Tf4]|uniref:hypothetical protein n=1 Tax=Pontibacter sp. Tf4 TaxID=2761620 RepID=UPI001624C0F0|nr:hypothetical protein [Pontibacter sp. Tf4]MBB6612930.1 hypothetical protein [Pontibacter sp. Tf4]
MKKSIFMLVAAGLFTFAFASCDSPAENRAEENAEQMEDNAEDAADNMEDAAEDTADTTEVM